MPERYEVEPTPANELVKGDEVLITAALGVTHRTIYTTQGDPDEGIVLNFNDGDSLATGWEYPIAKVIGREGPKLEWRTVIKHRSGEELIEAHPSEELAYEWAQMHKDEYGRAIEYARVESRIVGEWVV